jgi:prepilin-type processing-associated H-X9-DG protein
LWSYKGTQYFSRVEVDPVGNVTYGDGHVAGNTFTTRATGPADTGSFVPGPNGKLVVNVPLDQVGGPPSGAILTSPNGQVRELVGTTATGGLIVPADQGGPQYDYQVGQTCH